MPNEYQNSITGVVTFWPLVIILAMLVVLGVAGIGFYTLVDLLF